MIHLPHSPNVVDGVKLHRQLAKMTPRQRALVALGLESGALGLSGLTRSQAAAIAEVSLSSVERAVKLLGPDRVLRVIDRLSAPMLGAAE